MKCLALLVFALASSNAFASKARLQALSQPENGSQYVDDKRDAFLNPAKAFRYGKWANFEWGASAAPATPNAEGGMFYSVGESFLGIQLGRESNAQARTDTANSISPAGSFSFLPPKNTVNLVFATHSNVSWGLQALYGSAQDNAEIATPGGTAYPNKSAKTFELGAGAEAENFDLYAKLDLQYSSENQVSVSNTHKLEGKPTFEVGGSYLLNETDKLYARILSGGFDARYTNDALKKEVQLQLFQIGFAHYLNSDADTRFYLSPAFEIDNTKISDGNSGMPQNQEHQRIPVTIGMEMTATDWLILRASVYQRIIIDETKSTVTDNHHENSTLVGAGAGISWKKLTVDGTLRGAMAAGNGQLDGNNFLANVGMTYAF